MFQRVISIIAGTTQNIKHSIKTLQKEKNVGQIKCHYAKFEFKIVCDGWKKKINWKIEKFYKSLSLLRQIQSLVAFIMYGTAYALIDCLPQAMYIISSLKLWQKLFFLDWKIKLGQSIVHLYTSVYWRIFSAFFGRICWNALSIILNK